MGSNKGIRVSFPGLAEASIAAFFIALFGIAVWFVAEPARAARLDRYVLYNIDDVFRHTYINISLHNAWTLLNPYLKLGYAAVNVAFLSLVPFGMVSQRLLNVLFSLGILLFAYRISRNFGLSKSASLVSLLLAVSFPAYFLVSLSTLAEIPFAFFLVWAAYLLQRKKYLFSSLVLSLLPTFRQEGLIFFFVWLALLPARRRVSCGLLLPLPFLFWNLANQLFLGHSFFYTFFCNVPDTAPYPCTASLPQFFSLAAVLVMHPLFGLGLAGLILGIKDPRFRGLSACVLTYGGFLFLMNILHLLDSRAFSAEIRFLVPLVPFLAIYGGLIFDRALSKDKALARRLVFFAAAILPFIGWYQIRQLQASPKVIYNVVTEQEDLTAKETAAWLAGYMEKEGIRNVYMPGGVTTDRIIRRIWMRLPGDLKYYVIIGSGESYKVNGYQPLDWATYTLAPVGKGEKGVFISKCAYDEAVERLDGVGYTLLKEEPRLSFYVYLMQKSGA